MTALSPHYSVKVLPLDFWMIHDEFFDDMRDKYVKCAPVFNRPGRYYDRVYKRCWFERWDNTAYSCDAADFLHDLECLEVEWSINARDAAALAVICKTKLATPRQRRLLGLYGHTRELRDLYRNSRFVPELVKLHRKKG